MSTRTADIFGAEAGALPAAPGTYGEAPRGERLPPATRLGRVRLEIADLARSVEYYERVLGMKAIRRTGAGAVLAARGDDVPLVELHEVRGARSMPTRSRLGLYHFAILLPDRAALGRFVKHLAAIGERAGASDHVVSEAFYLHDPDGLGIEVYADRPRSTWKRIGRELVMGTDPIDIDGLVRAAGETPWTGLPSGTVMGHVHLHVGDIELGVRFFADALGFDRMVSRYPGALFLAAGGYHHHLGTNTWAGAGARPPVEGDARLLEWTIEVPNGADVDAVAGRLTASGFPAERDSGAVITRDPWGTQIRIAVGPT